LAKTLGYYFRIFFSFVAIRNYNSVRSILIIYFEL
jgi:hypothetical protein